MEILEGGEVCFATGSTISLTYTKPVFRVTHGGLVENSPISQFDGSGASSYKYPLK